MAMTEKEWCTLAEARGLDTGTGKKLEPEQSSDWRSAVRLAGRIAI